MDYLGQLDSIFKKKIDGVVTGLLKDRKSFVEDRYFWTNLKKEYGSLLAFAKNSISSKLKDLEL